MAERLSLDDVGVEPPADVVDRVAAVLNAGELVIAPSDTVYGFLARAASERAREALRAIKGREGRFIALIGTWEEAREAAGPLEPETWKRLGGVWPGPVTAILPRNPAATWDDAPTVALRMPDVPFLRAILRKVGTPLFSTSANRPGQPPLSDGDALWREFSGEIALLVDAGRVDSPVASTIVDLTSSPPRIVREGRGDATPLLDRPSTRL